jgi:hypothetical protein
MGSNVVLSWDMGNNVFGVRTLEVKFSELGHWSSKTEHPKCFTHLEIFTHVR